MKFRFPIVIIDEDFRSENTSGLGIRALADAIVTEGMEVLGVTSYGDLSQFAQQQSRASAFILSIDDEEFSEAPGDDPAVVNLRNFIKEIRFKNSEIPIYLYGETRTSSSRKMITSLDAAWMPALRAPLTPARTGSGTTRAP